MPYAFFKAVEDTVRATLHQGLQGWEATNCRVTMTRSEYWPRQSHAHARFDKSMSSTGADFRGVTPLVLMAARLTRNPSGSSGSICGKAAQCSGLCDCERWPQGMRSTTRATKLDRPAPGAARRTSRTSDSGSCSPSTTPLRTP